MDQTKKITLNMATRFNTFKLFRFANPAVELRKILIKSMGIEAVVKNHLQPPETMFLPQIILNITIKSSKSLIQFNISFACHLYVICMGSYFIYMYSYAIGMSVVCTPMSSVCHSYVLVCHPYVTCMHSYVIRMSLVCTRM